MKLNKLIPTLGLTSVLAIVTPLASSCTIHFNPNKPDPEPEADYEYNFLEEGGKPYPANEPYTEPTLEQSKATQVYFDAISKDTNIFVTDLFHYVTSEWKTQGIAQADIATLSIDDVSFKTTNDFCILLSMKCKYHIFVSLPDPDPDAEILFDVEIKDMPMNVVYSEGNSSWWIQPIGYDDTEALIKELSTRDWSINCSSIKHTFQSVDLKDVIYDKNNFVSEGTVIAKPLSLLFEQILYIQSSYFKDVTPPTPIEWDYDYRFAEKREIWKSEYVSSETSLNIAAATDYYFDCMGKDLKIYPNEMLNYITTLWEKTSSKNLKEATLKIANFSNSKSTINMNVEYIYVDADATSVEKHYLLSIKDFPMEVSNDEGTITAWCVEPLGYHTSEAYCVKCLSSNEWSIDGSMRVNSQQDVAVHFDKNNCGKTDLLDDNLRWIIRDLLCNTSSWFLHNTAPTK